MDTRRESKMRFYDKGHEPNDGDVRYVTKFLLLPRRVGNMVVWLEFVTIRQVYDSSYATIECTREERWGRGEICKLGDFV